MPVRTPAQRMAIKAAQRASAQRRRGKGKKVRKRKVRRRIGAAGKSAAKTFGKK